MAGFFKNVGVGLGFATPETHFFSTDPQDRYQRVGQSYNHSATGGRVTTPEDMLKNMWGQWVRQNAGKNQGPVGVAEKDAWLRQKYNEFVNDRNNQQAAYENARMLNKYEVANQRRQEIADARQNASFDTGIASRGMLQSAANGDAPSQAAMLMQRRGGEIARNAMSMARSAREYNPALMSQAMNQGALAGVELGAQAGELRAQEMANARGQLLSADQAMLGARAQQASMRQGAEGMMRDEYLKRDAMQQDRDNAYMKADFEREGANVGALNRAEAAQMGAFGGTLNTISGLAGKAFGGGTK